VNIAKIVHYNQVCGGVAKTPFLAIIGLIWIRNHKLNEEADKDHCFPVLSIKMRKIEIIICYGAFRVHVSTL
jgi:hypothetical protein